MRRSLRIPSAAYLAPVTSRAASQHAVEQRVQVELGDERAPDLQQTVRPQLIRRLALRHQLFPIRSRLWSEQRVRGLPALDTDNHSLSVVGPQTTAVVPRTPTAARAYVDWLSPMSESLRCRHCGEVIGVYEPLVTFVEGRALGDLAAGRTAGGDAGRTVLPPRLLRAPSRGHRDRRMRLRIGGARDSVVFPGTSAAFFGWRERLPPASVES